MLHLLHRDGTTQSLEREKSSQTFTKVRVALLLVYPAGPTSYNAAVAGLRVCYSAFCTVPGSPAFIAGFDDLARTGNADSKMDFSGTRGIDQDAVASKVIW